MSGRNVLTWGMFEPDPRNVLNASEPTQADAYSYNAPVVRDAWAAAQDPQTWQDAAQQYGQGLLAGSIAPGAKGMALDPAALQVLREMTPGFRAYHGSPHSFDAFDSAKIGTGEGAQAYGHGLYLADSEGVARSYRDQLTAGRPNQAAADAMMEHNAATDALNKLHDKMVQETIATHGNPNAGSGWGDLDVSPHPNVVAKYAPEWAAGVERANSTKAAYEKASMETPKGHMYEVQVNADPAHFLDWDKPRDQQPQKVQDFISRNYPDVWDKAADGSSLYQHLARWASDNPKAFPNEQGYVQSPSVLATHILRDGGIPGIRYLDGGSRADGTGTSNHVIFDANTIAILRKYGIAGLIAGGGAAAAGNQSGTP